MPVTYSWFVCVNANNPCSPASYVKISGTPTCEGSQVVCAIYAQVDPNNPSRPLISQALCAEIATALSQNLNTENVLLRS